MGKTYLFGFPAEEFDNCVGFGVKPGQHAAHLFMMNEPGNVEVIRYLAPDEQAEVTPESTFFNEGDYRNSEKFISIGKRAAFEYERYSDDSSMKNVYLAMKDYLCATGRNAQQDAVKVMKIRMLDCREKLQSRIKAMRRRPSLNKEQQEAYDLEEEKLRTLDSYAELFQMQFTGDLSVSEDEQPPVPTSEPGHTFMGHTLLGSNGGTWKSSLGDLFPHDPSPNDVKQGVGLADCFMLSSLTAIADKNPQAIRDAMKDNGDGTVTIRFYDEIKGEKDEDPVTFQPHFVRVNKTIDQTLFGHNLNASSSLWVQMMEKGYAKYMEECRDAGIGSVAHPDRSGMGIINTEDPTTFMQAFLGEKRITSELAWYLENYTGSMLKKKDGAFPDHPNYYLPEENKLFQILSHAVNEEKDVMAAGNSVQDPKRQKEYHNVGIRTNHAYAILKCFEKDGKKYIQMRDPYGVFMPGYDANGKLVDRTSRVMSTLKGGNSTMGTFNLELKDFLVYFPDIHGMSEKTSAEISRAHRTFRNYIKHPLSAEERSDPEKRDRTFDDGDQDLGGFVVKEVDGFDMIGAEKDNGAKAEPAANDDFVVIDNIKTGNEVQAVGVPDGKEMPVQDALAEPTEADKIETELSGNVIPRNELKATISKGLQDLNATDSMFYFDNREQFEQLKESLTSLNKLLTKDGATNRQIAEAMVQLRRDADAYVDYKVKRITEENKEEKKQSPRAMHRLHAAASLSAYITTQKSLTDWPEKQAEQIAIVMNDMDYRLENKDVPGMKSVDEKQITKMKNLFQTQLDHNPKLKADVEKARHPEKQNDIFDEFVNVEIARSENVQKKDIPEPKTLPQKSI